MPIMTILIVSMTGMLIGMLWYSPVLFAKPWMRLSGVTPEAIAKEKKKGMLPTYAGGFLNNLIMSAVLFYLLRLTMAGTLARSATVAFLVWIGFIATTQFSSVLWEKKPFLLYLINAGYYLAVLLAGSAIFCVLGLS